MSNNQKKVVIYTTPFCPFCVRAKQFLEQKGIKYKDHDVSRNFELREKISRENGGFRTVPMIFVGDVFIGGYDQMMASFKNGQFLKLLNED